MEINLNWAYLLLLIIMFVNLHKKKIENDLILQLHVQK